MQIKIVRNGETTIIGGESYDGQDELMHYGVPGMKWGVRRATKMLSTATTSQQRDKAIAKLNKHKTKGTAKVAKLEKKHVQLEKDVNRHIQKSDVKAAKLMRESTRVRNKAYGMFTSSSKAAKRLYKADKLKARAEEIKARSDSAKAKLAKNEKMTELFKNELKNIDSALSSRGKKFVNG